MNDKHLQGLLERKSYHDCMTAAFFFFKFFSKFLGRSLKKDFINFQLKIPRKKVYAIHSNLYYTQEIILIQLCGISNLRPGHLELF